MKIVYFFFNIIICRRQSELKRQQLNNIDKTQNKPQRKIKCSYHSLRKSHCPWRKSIFPVFDDYLVSFAFAIIPAKFERCVDIDAFCQVKIWRPRKRNAPRQENGILSLKIMFHFNMITLCLLHWHDTASSLIQ